MMSRIEAKGGSSSLIRSIQAGLGRGLNLIGAWKGSLLNSEIAHTVLLPSQPNISKYIQQVEAEEVILNQGSIEIIERLVGHPLDRGRYRQLKQLLGGKKSNYQRMEKDAVVEVRLIDGVDIARIPSLFPFPEELPKVVAITSFDYLLSDVYLHHSFSTVTLGGEPLSLWDDEGKAYPPDDLLKDSIEALYPGDSIKFSNGDGLTMTTTILPIQEGKPMPQFVLAVEKNRAANFQATIAEARRRDLAILWKVKEAHLGLMEALFWRDLNDPTKRVFIQDRSGNQTTFDNKELGRFRFAREIVHGTFDSVIEYTRGDLEEEWQKDMQAIKTNDPFPRHFRLLTVGIGDNYETGRSLAKYALAKVEGKYIIQCPPVAVTFSYNQTR
ncbi:hypothetical protein HYT18_02190 [Candidatus Microgenomates bacterium]|nr:hypothetical protein [Candidatus Microgenomates bacterium]